MARISQETIEQVNSVSILELAEVLGDQPRRAGKQYQICCPNPQHQENTPDTFIEPNRNISVSEVGVVVQVETALFHIIHGMKMVDMSLKNILSSP